MSNILQAMINCPYADNHCLYSLLFFLHIIYPDLGEIDSDAPLSRFDEDCLLIAGAFVELHLGIDIPDALLADKTKTLRELADEIRLLQKISNEQFQNKLLLDRAAWRISLFKRAKSIIRLCISCFNQRIGSGIYY